MIGAFAAFAAWLSAVPANAAPSPSPSPALTQANAANDLLGRYRAQAGACRWGRPTFEAVIYREAETWKKLAALEDSVAAAALKRPEYKTVPCGAAEDAAALTATQVLYWQWTSRLVLQRQLSVQAGWTKDLFALDRRPATAIETLRADIETRMVAAQGMERSQEALSALRQESVLIANLVCEPRKSVRSAAPRTCPEIPATYLPQRPLALIRAEAAELLSSLLVDALAREERGEFGVPHHLKADILDQNFQCRAEEYVIYPESPLTEVKGDVLEVSVHRFGKAGLVKRIRVKKMNGDYVAAEETDLPGRYLAPDFGRFTFCMPPI
jgi:hypothetical protein